MIIKAEIVFLPEQFADIRKALNAVRELHNVIVIEKEAPNNRKTFEIAVDNPVALFDIGKFFGIAQEFKSFDHRTRKLPED